MFPGMAVWRHAIFWPHCWSPPRNARFAEVVVQSALEALYGPGIGRACG